MAIDLKTHPIYLQYKVCINIYELNYQNALDNLKAMELFKIKYKNNYLQMHYQLKYNLQFLSIYLRTSQYDDAARSIFKIISLLNTEVTPPNSKMQTLYQALEEESKNNPLNEMSFCGLAYQNYRQVLFLDSTIDNVMGILIHSCIIVFTASINEFPRDSLNLSMNQTIKLPDNIIGNIIILSQFNFSFNMWAFNQSIRLIKDKLNDFSIQHRQPLFSYPAFSAYVTNVNILEEFVDINLHHNMSFQFDHQFIWHSKNDITKALLKILQNDKTNFQSETIDLELLMKFLILEISPLLMKSLPR